MPNFTPNSKIHIGRVPFDASYRHTMTFASASAQQAYFASVCTTALSKTDYTYVRMNNSIRVPFNAESLYTYNYVMYQNANYGSKWFYAFIVGVNYVNENMTELVLQLDVMQTWYFDYTLEKCFVEREHVNDDAIGAHLNPEPAMELEYKYQSFFKEIFKPKYVVFLANAYPRYNNTDLDPNLCDTSEPYSGHVYYGQYSAAKVFMYDLDEATSVNAMVRDLEAWNKCGGAESIVDAFTIPSNAIVANDKTTVSALVGPTNYYTMTGVYTLAQNTKAPVHGNDISRPTTIDGYTPHNNKLFTYPYCFIEVGDFSGRKQDYRWEFFTLQNIGGTYWAKFELKIPGISDGIAYLTPKNYNGIADGSSTLGDAFTSEPFTFSYGNKVSWIYSVYQNWAAQNKITNELAVVAGTGAMLAGAFAGAPAAAGLLGAGMLGSALLNQTAEMSAVQKTQSANVRAGAMGMAGGAMTVASTLANIEKMKRIPNQAKGNVSGNSRLQCDYNGYYEAKVVIRQEFAKIVDGFFDMYGYQVDSVKVPNRTGRTSWNYVKCSNSCHRGNVPADDMALINEIYNKGITFWHTSDVGNYSLNNAIV